MGSGNEKQEIIDICITIFNKNMNTLQLLAEKYEKPEFINGDPSWFMHQIDGNENRELIAFIASALSYGSRKQFLPKIQTILDHIMLCNTEETDGKGIAIPSPTAATEWLKKGRYKELFPNKRDSFYRLYSYQTFRMFLDALASMVTEYGSMKNYLIATCNIGCEERIEAIEAIDAITTWFNNHNSKGVIPKNSSSSCKRVCMFLRWMVRKDSPVDLGIWNDIIAQDSLIIPMDVHVVTEAIKMGLIKSKSTSMANARRLTDELRKVFPEDPTKGDFALFGLGVDTTEE